MAYTDVQPLYNWPFFDFNVLSPQGDIGLEWVNGFDMAILSNRYQNLSQCCFIPKTPKFVHEFQTP